MLRICLVASFLNFALVNDVSRETHSSLTLLRRRTNRHTAFSPSLKNV